MSFPIAAEGAGLFLDGWKGFKLKTLPRRPPKKTAAKAPLRALIRNNRRTWSILTSSFEGVPLSMELSQKATHSVICLVSFENLLRSYLSGKSYPSTGGNATRYLVLIWDLSIEQLLSKIPRSVLYDRLKLRMYLECRDDFRDG